MTTVIYHNIPVLILLHHYTAIAGSKFRLFYLLRWIKDAFKWRSKVVEFHQIFLMRSLLLSKVVIFD